MKNIFLVRPTELWICYSSVSYFLFYARQRESAGIGKFLFCLAPTSPLSSCTLPLDYKSETRRLHKKYCNKAFIILAITSLLHGRKLIVRIPHLNNSIINATLRKLYSLNLIKVELYDDGFLGIIDSPTVCQYLRPQFQSICCWKISKWTLCDKVQSQIQNLKIKSLNVIALPCSHLIGSPTHEYNKHSSPNTIIIEAKYMDYSTLSKLVVNNRFEIHGDNEIFYYQHYWSLKRNSMWPDIVHRKILTNVPVEYHVCQLLNSNSHIITGMTSTIVLICELAKQRLVPRHKITLLLDNTAKLSNYHNTTEVTSFINYLHRVYSMVLDLNIVLNGEVLFSSMN